MIHDLNLRLRSCIMGHRSVSIAFYAPWHFLYFFPLPHGHGSLRPIFVGPAGRVVDVTGGRAPPRGPVPFRPVPFRPGPLLRALPLVRSSVVSLLAWPLALAISSTLVRTLRGILRCGSGR